MKEYREKITVKELIDILSKLDIEKEICTVTDECGYDIPVQDVTYNKDKDIYEIN